MSFGSAVYGYQIFIRSRYFVPYQNARLYNFELRNARKRFVLVIYRRFVASVAYRYFIIARFRVCKIIPYFAAYVVLRMNRLFVFTLIYLYRISGHSAFYRPHNFSAFAYRHFGRSAFPYRIKRCVGGKFSSVVFVSQFFRALIVRYIPTREFFSRFRFKNR